MRKSVALVVAVSLVACLWSPFAYAQAPIVGTQGLVVVEEILYGRVQDGALLARVEQVERDLLGHTQDGSALLVRVEKLLNLLTGAGGEISLKLKLNAVEWVLSRQINEGPSISRRLEQMELVMYGEPQTKLGLVERLDQLLMDLWPGGKIYAADAMIPKATLVRIELLTEINSESAKVDDPIRYRVVDDVRLDNQVVIAAGAEGRGHVVSVQASGNLGRDGQVQVDFGTVSAMDSQPVRLQIAEQATVQNQSLELATGASLAGVVLLGPIGLTAGYFVRGRPHVVPVGTRFYVEVMNDTRVTALSLVPVSQ